MDMADLMHDLTPFVLALLHVCGEKSCLQFIFAAMG
jgi:hypothetical protein